MKSGTVSLIVVCILCLIVSSAYSNESYRLKNLGACKPDTVLQVLKCPLNSKLFESQYRSDLGTYLKNGTLRVRHFVNPYYTKGLSSIALRYCDAALTKCGTVQGNTRNLDIPLTEDLLYVGEYENKDGKPQKYLYVSFHLVETIIQELPKVRTLADFTVLLETYRKDFEPKKGACRAVTPKKFQDFYDTCVFIQFPYDGIVKVLREILYKHLDDQVTQQYNTLLNTKIAKKEGMTTFEFFSYFAIQSLDTPNVVYKFLTLK